MTVGDMEKPRKVLVVLAYYQNENALRKFLQRLGQMPLHPGWTLELAICDNTGNLRDEGSWPFKIHIYLPNENLHYMGGCWHALRRWNEQNENFPEWVVIANYDLLLENDFWLKLLGTPFDHLTAVVGPNLRVVNGRRQNPWMRRRPSRLKITLLKWGHRYAFLQMLMEIQFLIRRHLLFRLCRLVPYPSRHLEASLETVYAVHGSMMLFRRIFFENGGSLLSECKMYHEEFLVAERIRRMNLRIVWASSLHVLHCENAITGLTRKSVRAQWRKHLSTKLEDIFATGEQGTWIPLRRESKLDQRSLLK